MLHDGSAPSPTTKPRLAGVWSLLTSPEAASPQPAGEGVVVVARDASTTTTPTPNPSPQGGGEQTEFVARLIALDRMLASASPCETGGVRSGADLRSVASLSRALPRFATAAIGTISRSRIYPVSASATVPSSAGRELRRVLPGKA